MAETEYRLVAFLLRVTERQLLRRTFLTCLGILLACFLGQMAVARVDAAPIGLVVYVIAVVAVGVGTVTVVIGFLDTLGVVDAVVLRLRMRAERGEREEGPTGHQGRRDR